ncbi:class I SAM-dependent methyltransferase [Kaistella palustris]|uniref:class I SAM-dependent methyltransferase n=1 Tax=Kaistella palustris TaxID=493376 RepID=UPI000484B9CB|nr:class I SAM-dependent methyltransferase [Kaistella palustris]
MKDLMGQAIWDFYRGGTAEDLLTETSISEIDELPVAYFFRSYNEMNQIEQKALALANGSVLDIGAGAGSHSLYLQKERKLDVLALDFSRKSIEVCRLRGVRNSVCADILQFSAGTFDTILLLMNGTGIFQSLNKIDVYLKKLYSLLNNYGQVLIDSTDILYMYDRVDDGGFMVPADHYYGEVDYFVHYKLDTENPIKWLYLDFETLKKAAENNGFKIEKILQQDDSFLARLTKKDLN